MMDNFMFDYIIELKQFFDHYPEIFEGRFFEQEKFNGERRSNGPSVDRFWR